MGGMFGGGGKNIETVAPRINSVRFQSSSYGKPIPIVMGRRRLAGNVIWFSDFNAIPITTTQETGGKGGGGGGSMSNTTYIYVGACMVGICEGPIYGHGSAWNGKELGNVGTWFTYAVYGAYPDGTLWPWLAAAHPAEALSYQGLVLAANENINMGDNAQLGSYTFEVYAPPALNYGGGVYDCDPKDVLINLLSNDYWGAGFPYSKIGDLTAFSNYTVANDFLISPLIEEQQPAAELIRDLMEMCNCEAVFSEGTLKVVPYGDAAASGNGVSFTPSLTPQYDFTDADFIVDEGEDPVRCERSSPADAINQVQVEYTSRDQWYASGIAEAKDEASILTQGLRPSNVYKFDAICTPARAQWSAQHRLQYKLFVRNKYTFTVDLRYSRLEPMDLVTLTDSRLGLNRHLVRVKMIEETEEGFLQITAEDTLIGNASPAAYNYQPPAGYTGNYNASPGSVSQPYFFEPPVTYAGATGLQVWCAVTGAGADWGGCNVWVSFDGASYKKMATLFGGSRYGTLRDSMTTAIGSDAKVQMVGKNNTMLSGSAADANNLATLLRIGSEYISYDTATLVATGQYDLNTVVRGAYGTTPAAHTTGTRWVRVDDAIAKSEDLDTALIGQTLYFKFTSFNLYQGGEEDLGSVTAYTYTVSGNMVQLPPSDVQNLTYVLEGFGVRLIWDQIPDQDSLSEYEIRQGGTTWEDAVSPLGAKPLYVKGTSYLLNTQNSGATKFWVKARDKFGNESLNAAMISGVIDAPDTVAVSATISGVNLRLSWEAVVGSFAIDHYEVKEGATYGAATLAAEPYSTAYELKVTWSGGKTFWVSAVDVAGNKGSPSPTTVNISSPTAPTISSDAVDNNVLLRWTESAATLPIDRYELRKGGTSWETASFVGYVYARFAAVFENVGGTYTYWIAAIDSAGTTGAAASHVAEVSQPPDFVLITNYTSSFGGTLNNVVLDQGALYTIVTGETWQQHFVNNSWASPQDQVNAGYPVYIQPTGTTGYYEETVDIGTVIAAGVISLSLVYETLLGSVTITPKISIKQNIGDAWTDYNNTDARFCNNFRYIKMRWDFSASGGNDLIKITALGFTVGVKEITERGTVDAVSTDSGGTTVTFAKTFYDVSSIQVSAGTTNAYIPVYDFVDVANPTSMKVLVFDRATGNRVSCPVSYIITGAGIE